MFGAAVGLLMIDKRSLAGWLVLAVAGLAFIALNPLYLLFWVAGGMIATAQVKRFGWLGLAGIVLLLGGTLLYELAETGAGPAWAPLWVGETLVALGMVMLLPALVARPVQMMLRPLAGVATGLSAISYSLYLVHYPVMKLTELLMPPTNGGIAVSIVDLCLRTLFCIAVSIAFYFAVEARTQWVRQHVLDWGRRAGQARARLIRGPLRSR